MHTPVTRSWQAGWCDSLGVNIVTPAAKKRLPLPRRRPAEPDRLYATPRAVAGPEECHFYHAMDIPGHGAMEGEWDLRGKEFHYLGGTDVRGKRVLEFGAASGFLTTYLERSGADVVAYDLSENYSWDIVPFDGVDHQRYDARRKEHMRRLNNGFWLNHTAQGLRAKLVHGTVYDVPAAIGKVDISTFCAILLHLRDPFLALQNAARLTAEKIIVTEAYPAADYHLIPDVLAAPDPKGTELAELSALGDPRMVFLPQHWDKAYPDTWWHLSPAVVQRFLGVLGFERTEVTYHFAPGRGHRTLLHTVVGQRTKPLPEL